MELYKSYVREYATTGQKVQCWHNNPGEWQSGDLAQVMEKTNQFSYRMSVKWLSGQRIGQTSDIDHRYVNLL